LLGRLLERLDEWVYKPVAICRVCGEEQRSWRHFHGTSEQSFWICFALFLAYGLGYMLTLVFS